LDNFENSNTRHVICSEKLPRLDHFRLSKRQFQRPSVGELYGDAQQRSVSREIFESFYAHDAAIKNHLTHSQISSLKSSSRPHQTRKIPDPTHGEASLTYINVQIALLRFRILAGEMC
jgi:hypothetical protein